MFINGQTAINATPIGNLIPSSGVFTATKTNAYTVATLPAPSLGLRALVTDALAPTALAVVAGGGAVSVPVFYNGASWIVV